MLNVSSNSVLIKEAAIELTAKMFLRTNIQSTAQVQKNILKSNIPKFHIPLTSLIIKSIQQLLLKSALVS